MKWCLSSLLSRTWPTTARSFPFVVVLFLSLVAFQTAFGQAQQDALEMKHFVIFSGVGVPGSTTPTAPGYAVQLGSSANINGGSIGSLKLVKTTGNVNIIGNIFSQGTIVLANGAKVTGRLAASNSSAVGGTILSAGSNVNFGGNIDVNGNIVIAGGIVSGKVTHPDDGSTYVGPSPGMGEFKQPPSLPSYPSLPPIANFDPHGSAPDITKTAEIEQGPHNSIKLSGNQILTFKGPGTYRINSIDNKNANTFVFDFKNLPGDIRLHVHNNANLAKLDVSIMGGGDASRILIEVHGKGAGSGKYAVELANGAPGGTKTRISGTVWAPYAAINIGSGTGSSEINGALWSGTQVNIQSGVNINFVPFGNCPSPSVSTKDAIVCSTANGGNTAVLNLNEYVTISGGGTASFSKNGTAILNPASFVATSGDVITVAASISPSCSNTATFNVTVNDRQKFGICSPQGGKVYEIITSELTMLQKLYDPANPTVSNEVFTINNTTHKVLIEAFFYSGQSNNLISALTALGFEHDEDLSDLTVYMTVAGYFPIAYLDSLNNLNQTAGMNLVKSVRNAFPPAPNVGDATTQGDIVMRSDLVKLGYFNASTGYPLAGSGVKVGIMSDSYNRQPGNPAAIDKGNWDLPGAANHPFGQLDTVDVIKEYPAKYGIGKDEGRAMLQIVHDIAPRAELAFRTASLTAPDMAKGIFELKDAGCDIICDDITYITEPFYTPGIITTAVNSVANAGVKYFTSAGNFGDNAFKSVFKSVADQFDILPKNEGTLGGRLHAFSLSGDTEQTLTVYPGTYTIALQWDDPNADLDIYLKNFQGQPLFGFNHKNTTETVEVLSFSVATQTTVNLVIAKECESCNDTELINFMYVVFRGVLKDNDQNEYFPGSSTIVAHAAAEGAMAVGAILYTNTPEFDFENPAPTPPDPAIVDFTVATFSSVGEPGGASPAFTAPNGVNTTVNFGAPNLEVETPVQPNFYGTSAAAPHAAAVAALAMEGRAYYWPSLNPKHLDNISWGVGSSPHDIKKLLQSTATDMHEPGFDIKSGAGLIRAHAAMLTLAAPNPEIIDFAWADTANPGEATFTLTIVGRNLYEESQVLFGGTLVTTTYDPETETLQAQIPPFEDGNPLITVNNNPISQLGTDGGSDQRPLFDIPQPEIFVRAIDVTKKYGEIVPEFEATVYVLVENEWIPGADFTSAAYPDGITLGDVGLTNEDLSHADSLGRTLIPVQFTSPITTFGSLSNVGRYLITPSHEPTDLAFLEQFKYAGSFDSTDSVYTYNQNSTLGLGAVEVQKLPIVIKLDSLTVTYGETIADKLDFKITYDASKIVDNTTFSAKLNDLYAADQNQAALAIVDQLEFNGLTLRNDFNLTNYSFMVSGLTLRNALSIRNGLTLYNVYVPIGSFFDYEDVPDDQTLLHPELNGLTLRNALTLYNALSLRNGLTLMNGLTLRNALTLYNGANLEEMEPDEQTPKILVIFGDDELENAEVGGDAVDIPELELFSINLVSGTSVGEQISVPGAFINPGSFNFDPTYAPGSVTITPLSVTVTANAISKTAGQADPALTFTSVPAAGTVLANGDTITFSGALTRDPGESPGMYNINVGTLSVGNIYTANNYTLLFGPTPPAKFTIGCPAVPVIKSFDTAIGAGSSKPPKVNNPNGTTAGDLLIVGMMFEKGTNTTPTAPAGWTLIRRTNQTNNVGMATYYKIAGSNEAASYTFGLTNGPKWSIGITRIQGADPTNPIDVHDGVSGGPAFNADAPSLTTTVCNALVMAFYTNKKDATWTPAAGTTELYDKPNTQQGLTSNMMAYYSQPDAGITGAKTATASISDFWVAQQLAIKPIQGGSGSSSGRSADLAVDNTFNEESQSFGDPTSGVQAYPNPVRDRVVIQIEELTQAPSSEDVSILDRVGKSYPVKSAWDGQNNLLEIDFAPMGTGIYFIRVNTTSGSKSVRVMKVSE